MLQYEFDTWEEYSKAWENLSAYHDCEKCHNKIVCIACDGLGNTKCGYCGELVKYPRMKREFFTKWLSEQKEFKNVNAS